MRGPNGEPTSPPQRTEERTPHPNPLPSKARGEGTGKELLTAGGFRFHDDFSQPRPDDWQPLGGEWVYENGHLIEKAVTGFATNVLKRALPQDVRIKVRYRPLAPGQYRSIGFSFDYVDQGHSQDIYTHTGDATQTVQAFHRIGGQQVYPAAGIVQTKDLKVGEEATIEITARGQQLTILLNGTKRLDYVMPVARRTGKFSLWVHSGSAEFLELDIRELVASREDLEREVIVARDAVALLELKRVTTLAEVESLRTRIEAERAKYAPIERQTDEATTKRKSLVVAASNAEKAVTASKAREAVLQAEQFLMSVKPSLRFNPLSLDSRRAATVVPSPPSSGERARVRGPSGEPTSQPQTTEERTPHPNPLPTTEAAVPEASGEGTGADIFTAALPADALFHENSPAAMDAEAKLNVAKATLAAAITAMEQPDEKYAPVGEMSPSTSTGRRTALAQWITSNQNPRTARVAMNHIWLRHFGQALVPSVANFGLNGDQPSHPELLDWLAVELMENGWRMKPIHRMIVLSAAYRMSSAPSPLAPAGTAASMVRGEGPGVKGPSLVPSPPSARERARVRGPSGEPTSPPQTTEQRTPLLSPHPSPLPAKPG